MAKKPGRVENLIPTNKRTKDEARDLGAKGGKKSGEVRRERRLMSQIYRDFLAKSVPGLDVTGEELLEDVAAQILMRKDAASVSLIKEMREATEGQKVDLSADVTYQVIPAKKPDAND